MFSEMYYKVSSGYNSLHSGRRSGLRALGKESSVALVLAGALVAAPVTPLHAQEAPAAASSGSYEPQSGQPGKDVVWVPTPDGLVERMLDMAQATPDDYLVDLGAGDGRTVIAAAKRGLRAHGIEYNPELVKLAKQRAEAAGVSDRATFVEADIFESDFSDAQVLTLFLLPSLNERLRPTILEMKPGTRVVSNSFRMGDWEPDQTSALAESCTQWCTAHLWIVPAKVEGSWQLGEQTLELAQTYQQVTGTLGGTPISDARLKGTEITFKAGGVEYSGTVNGTSMTGKAGANGSWSATRTSS